ELNSQRDILEIRKQTLISQKDSINRMNILLQKKLEQLKLQSKDLENYGRLIKSRQTDIEKLNREIINKNIDIGKQSEIIVWQKQLLIFLIIIAVLVLIIILTIYMGYRNNKHKSNILAEQKKEIEAKLNELEELNIKLKDADQYKSIFLASMSHELRTPLNSIIGYTGIMLMGMTGSLNEEQNKQLSKVKNNARHLLSLINDILDISKIEADRVELHIEECNLKELVNQIVETIYPKAAEKNLEIKTNIDDDMIVFTDIRRLKQVVINLVSNAVNYSAAGSINIFSDRMDENKFRLTVKDTGIGIAENELSKLFQPFQQIDSSLTKKNSGTGLGLYLCRKLMKLLGGDIYVRSEPGIGSEFFIEMQFKIIQELSYEKSTDNRR
ncbi:MAG: Histidine kinase protein, partial [Bacteroidota bacterium]|nr:Histidine kinase protein [Bacteroidota bacterium]